MKKIISLILAVCAALSLTACEVHTELPIQSTDETSSVPVSSSEVISTVSEPEASSSTTESFVPPEVIPEVVEMQQAAAIYCVEDKKLIASENIDAYISTASLLKLLTASVALRYLSSDKVITVGTELALVPEESSLCLIEEGHMLTLHDLLIGLLLPSGNDAAYTIAVTVARELGGEMSDEEAVKYFTDRMNDFAFELGMRNSYFVTPDGSDDPRQFSTAADMLLIAEYALTVPEIREIIAMPQSYVTFESGEEMYWTNSNNLLNENSRYYCPEAIGMKTGFTDSAGLCLIGAFEKDGKTYIVIVTGFETGEERYTKIAEYYAKVGGKIGDIEVGSAA